MLEEGPEVAILGNVGQKLKRHQNIFVTRHCRQHALSRGGSSIAVVESIGARNDGRRVVVVGVPSRRQSQSTVRLRRVVVDRAAINSRAMADVEGLCILSFRRIGDRQIVVVGNTLQHRLSIAHLINLHLVLEPHDGLRSLPSCCIISSCRTFFISVRFARSRRMLMERRPLKRSRSRSWRGRCITPRLHRAVGSSGGVGLRGEPRMQSWKHTGKSFCVAHRTQMEAISSIHCGNGSGQRLHCPVTMAHRLIGTGGMVMVMMVVMMMMVMMSFLIKYAVLRRRCHQHPRRRRRDVHCIRIRRPVLLARGLRHLNMRWRCLPARGPLLIIVVIGDRSRCWDRFRMMSRRMPL